jgi:hypothetical protein
MDLVIRPGCTRQPAFMVVLLQGSSRGFLTEFSGYSLDILRVFSNACMSPGNLRSVAV